MRKYSFKELFFKKANYIKDDDKREDFTKAFIIACHFKDKLSGYPCWYMSNEKGNFFFFFNF